MEQTWPASLDYIEEIRQFVLDQAEDLPPKKLVHMDLAIEEIIVNICSYAYETPPGEISVIVENSDEAFSVEFIDNGVPFDPLAADEPNTSLPVQERQQGGLGILLIRRVMDEVRYHHKKGRNCLKIVLNKG